jgi:hypothetical protein
MEKNKFAVLSSVFLAAAVILGGCVGIEPEMEIDEWITQSDEQDGEWVTDVELEADVESALGQPGLAAAYNGVCGSGYNVIDSHSVNGGTVYLTYNASTGKNCVVTIRNTSGDRRSMCAKVSLAFAPWNEDCGSYTTYAGPVYVYASNECIDWGGSIQSSSYYEYNTHCG